MAIWKTWHCHLGISIDIDVGIGNDIVIFVCLIIPGVLKRRKAESRGLYICVFLMSDHIRNHFLEIFYKFQNTFKKFD